jgi:predicted N-acetyltransferase YhbS
MDLIKRTFRHVQRSEHLLLAEMRDSGLFIPELSLVAEIDERKIVGHHMHNFPFFKR